MHTKQFERPSTYICGGRFLFVHKGLRLPLQQIGKCSAAFLWIRAGIKIIRNGKGIDSARIFVSLFPHHNSLIHTNDLAEFLFSRCIVRVFSGIFSERSCRIKIWLGRADVFTEGRKSSDAGGKMTVTAWNVPC